MSHGVIFVKKRVYIRLFLLCLAKRQTEQLNLAHRFTCTFVIAQTSSGRTNEFRQYYNNFFYCAKDAAVETINGVQLYYNTIS